MDIVNIYNNKNERNSLKLRNLRESTKISKIDSNYVKNHKMKIILKSNKTNKDKP